MAIHSMKDLLRKSLKQHGVSAEVTSSQMMIVANEFLQDVLPPFRQMDARAMSLKNEVLKINIKNGSVRQFLAPFEQELFQRLEEKFLKKVVSRIVYQISREI